MASASSSLAVASTANDDDRADGVARPPPASRRHGSRGAKRKYRSRMTLEQKQARFRVELRDSACPLDGCDALLGSWYVCIERATGNVMGEHCRWTHGLLSPEQIRRNQSSAQRKWRHLRRHKDKAKLQVAFDWLKGKTNVNPYATDDDEAKTDGGLSDGSLSPAEAVVAITATATKSATMNDVASAMSAAIDAVDKARGLLEEACTMWTGPAEAQKRQVQFTLALTETALRETRQRILNPMAMHDDNEADASLNTALTRALQPPRKPKKPRLAEPPPTTTPSSGIPATVAGAVHRPLVKRKPQPI